MKKILFGNSWIPSTLASCSSSGFSGTCQATRNLKWLLKTQREQESIGQVVISHIGGWIVVIHVGEPEFQGDALGDGYGELKLPAVKPIFSHIRDPWHKKQTEVGDKIGPEGIPGFQAGVGGLVIIAAQVGELLVHIA